METVDVRYIGSNGQYQTYSPQDVALINTALVTANFGGPSDYIEYFIKDLGGNVLDSNYNASQYNIGNLVDPITGTTTELFLDPEADAKFSGFNRGTFNIKYNFFTRQLLSAPIPAQNFWIKEISTSRTEIKVARQDLSNTQLAQAFGEFNAVLSGDVYYPTFYLNFGEDVQIIGVNAVYVEEDGVGYVIFKLYDPLPAQFDLRSTFWVVTPVANPAEFNVSINVTPEAVLDSVRIKGPNFKVSITDRIGQTTPYYNYTNLFATTVSSSYQQLNSLMNEKGIQINVDYSSFENFIHFSSATERLYNYVYKLQLIESASAGINATNTTQEKVRLQAQINNTIKNFDGYEYYLYFDSASTSWPKRNDTRPYSLYSVTSSEAVDWLGSPSTVPTVDTMSMYWSSSRYDDLNKDWLIYASPQYILDDEANAPYVTFLNMIGQHFDNIWIYQKDLSNRYSAENNPFVGISLDQVSEAIKSFGVQLYTNTSISDNLYYSLLGVNNTGSNLAVTSSNYSTVVYFSSSIYPSGSTTASIITPSPGNYYLSSSIYLPPFGEEKIFRYVLTFPYSDAPFVAYWDDPNSLYDTTSVYGQDALGIADPLQSLSATQIQDEIYKRLYHNLAYLLKTRGTERGVKALIACYGIPADILQVHEYGGYDYLTVPGIQEISNVRILTGSVPQISSSLLSPFSTIQYYSNDLEKTSITVQAGFSPADSINASITSSGYVTSSTQPGYFNIMQLIGNPVLQYSSSYIPLEQVSNTYFNAEYTSRYNVWDFIRLIKFFNNSLFKMMRDWVPARASADTGIVIKSHMLERNKYPRKEPTWSTSSFDADYNLLALSGSDGGAVTGSTAYVQAIPIQYNGTASAAFTQSLGIVYVSSSNDIQKYTGEFSGSYIIGATNYFSQEEISTYNYPWTSSVPGNGPLFLTYSISPIFQNVYTPVRSQRFLDLDFNSSQLAPVNFGLITQSIDYTVLYGNITQSQQPYSQYAYIQDFNYASRPSTVPRYSGSYLSGLEYNVYTAGDVSYGKEPVINYYTNKLGLFTQVATSSFLPGKVNVSLAYLADVSGGLFELNQNNKNWIDIQNIFVAGTETTIKQFDNKKYSNQVTTDGIKAIYNSGYSYTPQLYFSGSGRLYFQYVGNSSETPFQGYNTGTPNAFISGAANPYYSSSAGNIYNAFDGENPVSSDFTPGTTENFASYTASIAGQKVFSVKLGIDVEFPNPQTFGTQSISFSWGAYLNGLTPIGNIQTASFTSVNQPAGSSTGSIQLFGADLSGYGTTSVIGETGPVQGPFNILDNAANILYSNVGSPSTNLTTLTVSTAFGPVYVPSGSMPPELSSVGIVGYSDNPANATIFLLLPVGSTSFGQTLISGSQLLIDYTTPAVNLTPGGKVVFQTKLDSASTSNFTASFVTGGAYNSLTYSPVAVGQGNYPFANGTVPQPFIYSIADTSAQTSTITLSTSLSQFLYYQFVPYFVSASVVYSSSLYTRYGDINYPFDPQYGDKIVLYDVNGVYQDVDVISASISQSRLSIEVTPQVLDNWLGINPEGLGPFLLLKRYEDEQNVIVTFNKVPGATSYGFLVPETISPEVEENINTLQAAVQSQILNSQSPTPEGI